MTKNEEAFLALIRFAEGTDREPDPYRVCYGYSHTIVSLADHPAITGEWLGMRLPDEMCRKAGYGPGCKSTAAGAYQIIRPTWRGIKRQLNLEDFGPESQDKAALHLIESRGALFDVKAGRVKEAVTKCAAEWASLPGNFAKQPQRKETELIAAFEKAGGVVV